MNCLVCRHTESTTAFAKHGIDVVDCKRCGHRWADYAVDRNHIDATYGDDYFSAGGAGYDNYLANESLRIAQGHRYAKIVERYFRNQTEKSVLDVGAAAGFTLQGFQTRGWNCCGIEPNLSMVEVGRNRFGLDLSVGTLEDTSLQREFELVSMIQVVGHFADPMTSFQKAAELVADGGYCLIESWNSASLTARLFGQRWHEYSPPSVLHWFSIDEMRRLWEGLGFRQVAVGRPRKMVLGSHAKSLLAYKLNTSKTGRMLMRAVNLLPDSLVLPYPSEDLFWGLYRKEGSSVNSARDLHQSTTSSLPC